MRGHILRLISFFPTVSYQGAIYTHGEGPAPIPPQSMLVQPEMHLSHPGGFIVSSGVSSYLRGAAFIDVSLVSPPGLHPHQSGGPIASPALYGGPPVSLSPGQPPPPPPPQQLLPPPFYPPPGVVTFPYPAMYPSPQVHNHTQTHTHS